MKIFVLATCLLVLIKYPDDNKKLLKNLQGPQLKELLLLFKKYHKKIYFVMLSTTENFAQIIYADTEKLKVLRKDIAECARTLPKCENQPDDPLARVDVWHCALAKGGVFDDPAPAAIKKKDEKYCAIAITDPADVENCKKVVSRCVDKETQRPRSNRQKAINIVACILRSGVVETTVLAREQRDT